MKRKCIGCLLLTTRSMPKKITEERKKVVRQVWKLFLKNIMEKGTPGGS